MANNVMLVALKALNLCASAYIVIKLSTVLAIGIMFLIVSYAGVEDVGLSISSLGRSSSCRCWSSSAEHLSSAPSLPIST